MAWQQYRPPSPDAEAANTLSKYHAQLRAAESRDQLEINLDTEGATISRIDIARLRNVVFLWTIVILPIAGVATWFLDRVLAAETVAVVTAIVIFMTLPRVLRTSYRDAAP
jgi:hypothetical protein